MNTVDYCEFNTGITVQKKMEEKYRINKPQFLSVLKDQILEHEVNKKRDFWVRSQESDVSIAIDRNTLEEERQSRIKKRVYLQQFRDANKELMEKKWETQKNQKCLEDRVDRERLKLEPINWTRTLH
ncbi:uncharacterized protein LOC128160464 [Crassostrea angulata]|uniref:uncharacterized protein LOC128160464 n=1 Tax=Magallana angulata TaxID=2784310 RepID=UPI0022B1EFAE|nr:uncharacterized protein LOC128160464 [Crassostrea angulata]